jgi:hypothetical protein
VLDQPQQGGQRRHEPPAHLLVGEPVDERGDPVAVVVEERLELDPFVAAERVVRSGGGAVAAQPSAQSGGAPAP